MEQSSNRTVSLSRRHRRIQQLIPEEGVRRSPRIRRSGNVPYYGNASRSSRESSTVSEEGSTTRRSVSSSRRSSRSSEILNESGQLMYEESESEDQDVTITASTQVRPPLSWKATLPRTPRVLSSLDSGVSSGSAGSSDEQRLGSPSDLPKHLYGLDKDDGVCVCVHVCVCVFSFGTCLRPAEVEVTHTTQYVYNKEKILTPPKVPPPPPVSPQPTLCSVVTQWVCCVLSVPYFAIVSLIAVDVTALDKLAPWSYTS